MHFGSKTSNSSNQSGANAKRFISTTAALVIASVLITLGIVATSVQPGESILGQSPPRGCEEPPVEPRNVELWKHDGGILVQWDICPDHRYEIRWREANQTIDNPFDWPTETNAGRSGEFDITGLTNGRQHIVQLRPTHFEDNRFDRGAWSDDYLATPRRCTDLPEIPTDVQILPGDSLLTVTWNRCSGSTSHIRWRTVINGTGGDWSSSVDVGGASTYKISNLDNGTQYDIQVRSASPRSGPVNRSNGRPYTTDWSTPIGASPTAACPAGEPVVPKEFVVAPGNAELFATWRPCPDHEYQLAYRRRPDANPSWPSSGDWINVDIDGHRIRNLGNGTRYEIVIRSRLDGEVSSVTGSYVATPKRPLDNNRSPRWENVPRSISLVENRNYDHPIATIKASDRDREDAIRYEIIKPFPEPEIFPFAMNARDGEIYLYDKLDYEVIEEYEFTVRAIDVSGAEIEHQIQIDVIDAEGPAPPIFSRVCSTDTGLAVTWNRNNSKYDYELQRRPGSADANRPVWIDTLIDTAIDLPRNSDWVFRVRAIDKLTGEQSKWSSEEAVFVGGVANTAPKFRRDPYKFEVIEEQPAGLHVGFTVVDDPDRFSSMRFQIVQSSPEDAPFAINPFNGIVITSARLDFEAQNTYSLVVRATDLCGASDYVDVTITVLDDPNIDAIPLVPSAPSIIAKHNQVVVLWPTDHHSVYDLDWRKVNEEYRSRPEDADATMPRIVDLPDPDSSYAFRLRRVNQLGEPGEWSRETIVGTNVPSPTVEPIELQRQGQVLGDVQMYLPGITLRGGQTARLGFNMFGTNGLLDNSLINRRDVTARWRTSDGDLSDDRGRVVSYTAPDNEGVYKISVVVKQTVPGGIEQRDLEMVVHVVGSSGLVKPFKYSGQVPRNFDANGLTYGAISYFQAKEYRPPAAAKALFKVRENSIPSYEWVGVHIKPGDVEPELQNQLDGYTAIGDVYTSQFVSKDGAPIINMSFISSAAICLPVPAEWNESLPSLIVMRIAHDGTLTMMNLPVRFQPDPTFNDPALVCGHSEVFDGKMFLGIANEDIVTPTATSTPVPTDTATVIPTIEPTAIPTDTPSPTLTPTPDTSLTVLISSSTPTAVPPMPTPTSSPTPPATHTPTPTPTSISTNTPTPEPTATAEPIQLPTSTSTPSDTSELVVKTLPTETATPTQTPTSTATTAPTETPTSTPEPTHTTVPTAAPPTPRPTAEPEPPIYDIEDAEAPLDADDEEGPVSVSLIIFAVVTFLVLGVAIVSYIVYNNRVRQRLASPRTTEETRAGIGDDEIIPEHEENAESNDNEDDESPYDSLRYSR